LKQEGERDQAESVAEYQNFCNSEREKKKKVIP